MTRLDFYLHCSCNLNGVVVVGSGLIKDIRVTLLLFFVCFSDDLLLIFIIACFNLCEWKNFVLVGDKLILGKIEDVG